MAKIKVSKVSKKSTVEGKSVFEPVIGLETHLQLKTKTKMFCGCDAKIWQAKPNTHTCPVCLGLPGALPVPNQRAIKLTQLLGRALGGQLARESKFDRKNYFYPDLPKGYQISQYDQPLSSRGEVAVTTKAGEAVSIGIRRVHLEEDTGKSMHRGGETLLDFNKSGIPLAEVVTEPQIHSVEAADLYSKKVRLIARHLGVSDADMEKGQVRFEVNISLRPMGSSKLPDYRVEIKNLNSFRFVRKALEFEIERQTELLQQGKEVVQETRGYHEADGTTFTQREKEAAHDYRYFPEPDIPPLVFDEAYRKNLEEELPTLPDQRSQRYAAEFKLSPKLADFIAAKKDRTEVFEQLVANKLTPGAVAAAIKNWPKGEKLTVESLSAKLTLRGEEKVSDAAKLQPLIDKVLVDNPRAVADYERGKETALQFLLGQLMRETKGQVNPQAAKQLLIRSLA